MGDGHVPFWIATAHPGVGYVDLNLTCHRMCIRTDKTFCIQEIYASLTASLNEVRAGNKQLRTLVEVKQEAEGNLASSPTCPNDGGASSQPAHTVTLPELHAMANLPRKADRRGAQLG